MTGVQTCALPISVAPGLPGQAWQRQLGCGRATRMLLLPRATERPPWVAGSSPAMTVWRWGRRPPPAVTAVPRVLSALPKSRPKVKGGESGAMQDILHRLAAMRPLAADVGGEKRHHAQPAKSNIDA